MHENHIKRLIQRIFVFLVFFVLLWPFVWCLLVSLQSMAEVNSAFAQVLPRKLHPENFLRVLGNRAFLKGVLHSLLISLLSVAINVVISVPAGYALARIRTPLTKLFVRVMMMFVFVPVLLLTVPMRDMMNAWGLHNNYLMVALPMAALVMTTMTFWIFYSRFPQEMDDCAMILGLTPIQGFFRIYLPVSVRMIAYAAVIQFVTTWNCAFMPMFMYRRMDDIVTVQEAIKQFALNPSQIFLGMAAVLMACIPCWLLYIVRYRLRRAEVDGVSDPFRNSN